MDVCGHNRAAWDKHVEERNPWTVPVSKEATDRARRGEFELLLTPTKPVPKTWFPALQARGRIFAQRFLRRPL